MHLININIFKNTRNKKEKIIWFSMRKIKQIEIGK